MEFKLCGLLGSGWRGVRSASLVVISWSWADLDLESLWHGRLPARGVETETSSGLGLSKNSEEIRSDRDADLIERSELFGSECGVD